MAKVSLLGYDIDSLSFEGAVARAKEISGQVVTINPEMISNPDLLEVINSSELVIPDGIGVEIGLKIMGRRLRRIPGVEFAHRMIEECANEGKTVALVGAKPEIVQKTVENLKAEYQNLDIVYVHDGYFKNDEEIFKSLTDLQPRLVLCALGSPKQEFFINKVKKDLPNSLLIGVGGSFDVWAGEVCRAPEIWQKAGLEWLYRTIKEPERFKRIFPALPLFVWRVLKERYIPRGV